MFIDHIHNYMYPQVILLDGSNDEEVFFMRGVRHHVQISKTTLIELPKRATKSLDWITKVDSNALQSKMSVPQRDWKIR